MKVEEQDKLSIIQCATCKAAAGSESGQLTVRRLFRCKWCKSAIYCSVQCAMKDNVHHRGQHSLRWIQLEAEQPIQWERDFAEMLL